MIVEKRVPYVVPIRPTIPDLDPNPRCWDKNKLKIIWKDFSYDHPKPKRMSKPGVVFDGKFTTGNENAKKTRYYSVSKR